MRRLELLFFTLVNLLNYLDRYIVAAVLPLISIEMALTHEQGGRLMSAFVLGYVVFSPLFGLLGAIYSRPRLMALGVLVWSLATGLSGLASSYVVLILCRVMVGAGDASFGVSAPGYIRDRLSSPALLNSALSFFYAAIPVGAALGYVLAGQLTQHFSWHVVFFVAAVPGLILSGAFLFFPEIRPMKQVGAPVELCASLCALGKIARLRFAIGGYVLHTFALNGIAAFISQYGVSIGFSLSDINNAFGLILVVAGILGTLIGGRVAGRWAARSIDPTNALLHFCGVMALLAMPLIAVALIVQAHWLFLLLCFLGELLLFAGTGPINSVIVLSAPQHLGSVVQGLTIGLINCFGALLAPIVVGAVADRTSLASGMQVCSIALLCSAAIWMIGTHGRRANINTGAA